VHLRRHEISGGVASKLFFGGRIGVKRGPLTPRVREALRQLAAGPQDMRDDALLEIINDEMKKLPVDDIACVRDRVRFSCPPCPTVQAVVLMLNGLIDLKTMNL
jgi:hypothetical protein